MQSKQRTCQPSAFGGAVTHFDDLQTIEIQLGHCIENNRRTIECQNVTHFISNNLVSMY